MPQQLRINLDTDQRAELEQAVRHHPKPYLRERAAALLKIADGRSGRSVALAGLLTKHKTDTIYKWVHRYEHEGFEGLFIKPGRGRKPSFSPSSHHY